MHLIIRIKYTEMLDPIETSLKNEYRVFWAISRTYRHSFVGPATYMYLNVLIHTDNMTKELILPTAERVLEVCENYRHLLLLYH